MFDWGMVKAAWFRGNWNPLHNLVCFFADVELDL